MQKIGEMLIGSWKSGPVGQADEAETRTEIQMHIAPVHVKGLTDTMYVEIARLDAGWRPYRQAIFQLYTYKGVTRLRTYEITSSPKMSAVMTGLWLAPDMLPELNRDDLIATVDLDLKPSGDGYKGATPYAYPTGLGGAVEMTSEMEFSKDKISSVDRGYDATGKVVWGSSGSDRYTFTRFTPTATLSKLDGGLVLISYRGSDKPDKIAMGDNVAAHYTGWLYSNGTVFDTSRDRTPYMFEQGRLMQAWNQGLLGLGAGSVVRMVCPPELGFGANGAGRMIPPNATLVFEIEIMDVQKRPAEEPPAAAGQPGAASTPAVQATQPPTPPKRD